MNFKLPSETAVAERNENLYTTTTTEIPGVTLLRRMQLTDRETETLHYMAAGYTSFRIATDLFISKETVDSHRKNIIKKLRVANVTAAVAFALRNKLIS